MPFVERIRLFISGADVTRWLRKDGLPAFIETGVKGVGYYDFSVRGVEFPIIIQGLPVGLEREAEVKVYEVGAGLVLKGFVDAVRSGDESGVKVIEVFPEALYLKDVTIGEQVNLSDPDWEPGDPEGDDDDIVRDFDTGGAVSVREILRSVLESVNQQKGTALRVDDESCPNFIGDSRFFGNILKEMDPTGVFGNLVSVLLGDLFLDQVEFRYRASTGEFFLIYRDGGFHKKRVLSEGQWVNIRLKKTWRILGHEFGFDWGSIKVPSGDIDIPLPLVRTSIFRCVAGGLELVREHLFFPGWPLNEGEPDLGEYGSPFRSVASQNITQSKADGFARENGLFDIEMLANFDVDEQNSYALIKARKTNDLFKTFFVLSFESLFDGKYWATYRNARASMVIRDLAVVTDRWWMVDGDGRLWFLPRDQGSGVVQVQSRFVLREDVSEEPIQDQDIEVSRYAEENGKVTAWGLRLRENEFEQLKRVLGERFMSGYVRRVKHKILNPPPGLTEMKQLKIDSEVMGTVVSVKRALGEPLIETEAERYVNGN